MKKLFVALCAVAALSMVACKKETPKPTNPSNPTPVEQPQREGEYKPKCKISSVVFSDNTAPEIWIWDKTTGLLTSVNNSDYCGGYTEKASFTYTADGRVSTVTMSNIGSEITSLMGPLSGTMSVEYDGEYISSLTLVRDGIQLLAANVDHNSQHQINHMELDIDTAVINELLGGLMGGFNFGKGADIIAMAVRSVAKQVSDSKLSFNSASASVDFEWTGDNVSRMVANISVTGSVTLNEINSVVDITPYLDSFLQSFMGGMITSEMALALIGDMPLPVSLSASDTIEYTFDDQHNPKKGYMGTFGAEMLSANNVTFSSTYGMMNAVLSISLMGQGGDFPFSYPLPSTGKSFTYTYNDAGFPLSVTDSDDRTINYTYME